MTRALRMTPSAATLKRYGLQDWEYASLLERQDYRCPICKQVPSRPVIDHEHVPGWKKMKPAKRAQYVRGICCWRCNRFYLGRAITVERACNLADYLLAYQKRRKT